MGQLVFQLAPRASLLQSIYPIDHIWQINQPDIEEPPAIELKSGEYRFLIWRLGYQVRIDPLSHDQWNFLIAIQQSQTLLEIGATLPDLNLSAVLPVAMSKDWLTGFTIQTNEGNDDERS